MTRLARVLFGTLLFLQLAACCSERQEERVCSVQARRLQSELEHARAKQAYWSDRVLSLETEMGRERLNKLESLVRLAESRNLRAGQEDLVEERQALCQLIEESSELRDEAQEVLDRILRMITQRKERQRHHDEP